MYMPLKSTTSLAASVMHGNTAQEHRHEHLEHQNNGVRKRFPCSIHAKTRLEKYFRVTEAFGANSNDFSVWKLTTRHRGTRPAHNSPMMSAAVGIDIAMCPPWKARVVMQFRQPRFGQSKMAFATPGQNSKTASSAFSNFLSTIHRTE